MPSRIKRWGLIAACTVVATLGSVAYYSRPIGSIEEKPGNRINDFLLATGIIGQGRQAHLRHLRYLDSLVENAGFKMAGDDGYVSPEERREFIDSIGASLYASPKDAIYLERKGTNIYLNIIREDSKKERRIDSLKVRNYINE